MHVTSVVIIQRDKKPLISIVMPIYNQCEIVSTNLQSIIDCMSLPFEIILVNDASEDNTHKEIQRFIVKAQNKVFFNHNLIRITYLRNMFYSVFETKCDILGFKYATAPYVLEMQADMKILEKDFDKKLIEVLKQNKDLLAVSGRNCQTFEEALETYVESIKDFGSIYKSILRIGKTVIVSINKNLVIWKKNSRMHIEDSQENQMIAIEVLRDRIFPQLSEFMISGKAGYLDESIDRISEIEKVLEKGESQIYISETVSRGPILFDRFKYLEVGGFNKNLFFLGFDDHDLFHRALIDFGYRTAFVAFNFESKLANSTNRKKRNLKQSLIIEYLRYTKVRKFHSKTNYLERKIINNYHREIRQIR